MCKLKKLYNSIANLKELGIKLPKELLEETDRVEEEIIKNEVIAALSDAMKPIIIQLATASSFLLYLSQYLVFKKPLKIEVIKTAAVLQNIGLVRQSRLTIMSL